MRNSVKDVTENHCYDIFMFEGFRKWGICLQIVEKLHNFEQILARNVLDFIMKIQDGESMFIR